MAVSLSMPKTVSGSPKIASTTKNIKSSLAMYSRLAESVKLTKKEREVNVRISPMDKGSDLAKKEMTSLMGMTSDCSQVRLLLISGHKLVRQVH